MIKLSNRLLNKSLKSKKFKENPEYRFGTLTTLSFLLNFFEFNKIKIQHNLQEYIELNENAYINLPKCINKQNRKFIQYYMPIDLFVKYEL